MKKRFTEEQIVKILGEQKLGKQVKEIAREYEISTNTFFNWKKKYGDMTKQEIVKLRQFEEENERLKKLVANLSLDNMAQKEIIKKFCDPE
ncbi:transposase [Spirochaeta isovalerica]|uniref:Putative transposase n=1 Tax=Spirochaeta isovalerica TaxID=150 RepID=A0A841RFH5_9SPIO|nr:transposase [Spirochaeta isovalerica]MBB6482141.1 putative transposase [Spirochaeta isovalerica]